MNEPRETTATGRALRCDEARVLLMGYIDDELAPGDRRRVDDHLAVCVDCRGEERAYRRLGEVTGAALRSEVVEVDPGVAWVRIYERLESGLAYVLLWAGISLLTAYGLWQFAAGFLLDPEGPVVVRLGTGMLAAGGLLLLLSFIRDRLARNRRERYREVQR